MTTDISKKNPSEAAKPPIARLRIGLLNATIWKRTTEKGAFHTASFERRYRDADGNWQSTHSYDPSDLLVLAKLADQAHSKIVELEAIEASARTA